MGEDGRQYGPKKRSKRLKFSLLQEDWGEALEEEGGQEIVGGGAVDNCVTPVVAKLPTRRGKRKKSLMNDIADYFVRMEPIWEDDSFEDWAAPLWEKRPRMSGEDQSPVVDQSKGDQPAVVGGDDQPVGRNVDVEAEQSEILSSGDQPETGAASLCDQSQGDQPKEGDQPEKGTKAREGGADDWLGDMEDQDYFLTATSPYISLRYRSGTAKKGRRSCLLMEDDILWMEDDCVNARGGTTTTDPPTDIKDGQEDHTEKDPGSSLQDTRGDRQEVRMISSCLDHLGDGMPHDRGTTESVGTMAHTNTVEDVITIGVKAGMMDKEDDGQTSEEGVMKDGSIDTDVGTRMDDKHHGFVRKMLKQSSEHQLSTPSMGSSGRPVGGVRDVMKTMVTGVDDDSAEMTRRQEETHHADMQTDRDVSPCPGDNNCVQTQDGDLAVVAPSIATAGVSDEYASQGIANHHAVIAAKDARVSTINDPGVTSSPAECSYKKGVCNVHGRGAKLGWRKITKTVVGPDGRTTTRDTRKYFYTCGAEIGPRKKRVVQQTLPLSFTRDAKPGSDTRGDNDAKQAQGGLRDGSNRYSGAK